MFSPSFLFNPVTSSQDLDVVASSTLMGNKGICNMAQETYTLSCSDNEITVDEIKNEKPQLRLKPLPCISHSLGALGAFLNLSSQRTTALRVKSACRCSEAMCHFQQTPGLLWFTQQSFASTKKKAWRDEREGKVCICLQRLKVQHARDHARPWMQCFIFPRSSKSN